MVTSELSMEMTDLPDDPVELVTLYRDCKPQYDNAIAVATQIAATMNAIADALVEHEIQLPRVGITQVDSAAARKEQAKKMAAQLMAGAVNGNGYAPSPIPKAHAAQSMPPLMKAASQRFQRWSEQQEMADPNGPPPTPDGIDPDAWREEWRQANTPTPQDVLRSSGAYIPPQSKIRGSEKNVPDLDPVVAEVRAGAEAGGEFGFQQQAIAKFTQISAAAVSGAPSIVGTVR